MLIGKKVQLRAIEYQDLPLLIFWRNDPKIYQYFYEHEPLSLVMQNRWFEKFLNKNDEKFWILERLEDKQPIGTVGLVNIDFRNRHAELARVLVISKFQKIGVGKEMICLLLRYFFDHLNMNRLYCDTLTENEGAIIFYEKLGFVKEGLLREHIFKRGNYRDLVRLSILKSEYKADKVQVIIKSFIE